MNSAWDIDEITRQSLLYDFYGQLLTKRQQQVMELYHGENLSLAEIAEEFGISRQGVHDALRSARKALDGYEDKLGLVGRFLKTEAAVQEIDGQILDMIEQLQAGGAGEQAGAARTAANTAASQPHRGPDTEDLIRRLKKVKSIIDRLEE